MNRKQILFSLALLFGVGAWAQKSKTFKETFDVAPDAVLEINTSHADIEFDTWEKDQVEILATVTLEGANEDEMKEYFENDPIKILGNSKEIEISTGSRTSWLFGNDLSELDFGNFDFNFDVEPLFLDLEIPDLSELAVIPELAVMPPLPPMNFKSFDYGRYKDEGSEYLEEWAEGFQEGFDEEYQQKMKEWGKRVEERAKAWEERHAKRLEERKKLMEERTEEWEKRAEERAKMVEERAKAAEERRRARLKARGDESPNIFYFSSDGEQKKYKVKKTIKIKMPKSVKLKMNVKHGEVKLASTAKDIRASLRYASLLASTIEGAQTSINASYSPVIVQNWNLGQLKADYSDHINLKQVGELRLNAVSSNVSIDKLGKKAFVTSNLGKLFINEIGSGFTDIDVSVQNGEVVCKVPSTSVSFYLNGTRSTINYPSDLIMERTENFDNVIHKGFKIKDNSGKLITINSKYSEVVLKE